ncbi:MAG: tyrosine--tRNA ligase [Candidatus Thermoplasmatota archaeon]|nr:tyrosine--tRNA ligase [Candidatus Thermoplasmatota archaeon]MBS3802865.1 tyrosine--tRNA ligase [Candidatus Thermoplasmatota archaeon]
MDIMDKLETILDNTDEVVTKEELTEVLKKDHPKAYIGFEPSGTVHLGWKICTNKIKDFLNAGFDFTVLLADWHAYINDKLGGDIKTIKLCGKYMEDCFAAMGVDTGKVKFVYASEYVGDPKYWELVLKTSKAVSVARVKRAMDIMGRGAEEAEKDLSKLFYPAMQVADIFYLDLDVAYGGTDQRHAHMLARDVSKKIEKKSPVALHTPLLTGLQAGGRMNPTEAKMSKSKPDSMISIHDTADEVNRKLKKAYCPEKQVEGNPVLEMCKFVVFPELNGEVFRIERPEKWGGNLEFKSYQELEDAFKKDLHPLDVKKSTAKYLNKILEPIHAYFEQHPENYEKMKKSGIITR